MAATLPPISQDEGAVLIQRLKAGSRVAAATFAESYMDWLVRRLRRESRGLHEHDLWTAAGDTIMSVIKNPERYDSARGTVATFLLVAARGDLKNVLAAERRHHRQQRAGEDEPQSRVVELSRFASERAIDEDADPAEIVERHEAVRERLQQARPPVPRQVATRLTPVEATVLQMMRDKVRRTSDYAAVLGITHLPKKEQRQRVKRVKDRLTKQVQRAGDADDATT